MDSLVRIQPSDGATISFSAIVEGRSKVRLRCSARITHLFNFFRFFLFLRNYDRTVWIVLPFKALILTLTCGGGLIAFAKYHSCDPIITKQVRAPDQIYPLFVMDSLSFIPGFTGLFVAGVFSGSLR